MKNSYLGKYFLLIISKSGDIIIHTDIYDIVVFDKEQEALDKINQYPKDELLFSKVIKIE